jgi:hypothetical protein
VVQVSDGVFTDSINVNVTIQPDTEAPTIIITAHPPVATTSRDATFMFSGTDNSTPPADIRFECKLDNSAFNTCTSPKNYTNLALGSHTFSVRAIDLAGNVTLSPVSFKWTIVLPPAINVVTGYCYPGSEAKGKFGIRTSNPLDSRLTLSYISSSNTSLVSKANVIIESSISFNTFSVVIKGAPGKSGTAVVALQLSNGAATTKFTINFVVGTNLRDVITGSNSLDMLFGMGGNDTLRGLNDTDLLCGGAGDDSLTGGTGRDFFSGGTGFDTVTDFNTAEGDRKDLTIP